MTLKIDDCQDHVRMASLECHAVSSSSCSDDDAGHEPRDLGITSLLSAAAHIDPSKLTIKSSDIEEKEADFRDLSARRDVPLRGSNDEIDTAPKSAQSSLGTNKMLSTPHPRKRKAETSAVYDPNHLSKIIQIQPSPTELEAANTDRTMNALLSWYDRLRELHMFKVMYGHAEVPQQYPENHALGIWVNKQRMQKRLREKGQKVSLSDHRVNLLNEVGFQWAKEKGDASWDHHYNELYDFYLQHNHCAVPTKYTENKALGRWVSTQRAQMKKWKSGSRSLMTNERYEKLCKLGFQFEMLPPGKNKNAHGDSDHQNTVLV